jgi:imidazolonepropionase-like amidohydrolase
MERRGFKMEKTIIGIWNGTVLPMAGGTFTRIPNGKVFVQDGKILAVGEEKLMPPELKGKEILWLDAQGGIIMPGIIEAHCHMGITEEKKAMEGDDCNENVNPVTPFLRAIDAINPMDAAFDDAVRAGITCAMIGPGSSNVVGGQFAVVKTKGRCIDDLVIKAPAAMKVAFGENPKVNFSGMGKSPCTRMAIAAMLREELSEAREYLRKKEKGDRDFETDFEKECWIPVLKKEIPLKAHVHRTDDILTAIRIAKEFDLDMTLDHCSEGHLIAEKVAESGFPAILGPDLSSRSKIEVQNMAFKTAGVLNRAGVKTAITTDHPVSLIQSLPLCAGLACKSGLPLEQAYLSITYYPADILGVADRIGSLEPGKNADIAVFTGNPMETFTDTLYTILDGEIIYIRNEKEKVLKKC